jgi:replicative DNA helicase
MSDAEYGYQATSRVPPSNLQAEESLLGAMMLSPQALSVAAQMLTPDDFYKPAYAHVFEAIVAAFERGDPADPVTVAEELSRKGLLDAVGGPALLINLQAGTPTISNAPRYAKIIYEHSKLRQLIAAAGEITEIGYDLPEDVAEAIDRAEGLIFQLNTGGTDETVQLVDDLMYESMDRLVHMFKVGDAITGIPTGLTELDTILSGLQDSSLYIVGARPSAGKTALGLTIANHVAIARHRPVLIFSLEMGHPELTQRMLAVEGHIDGTKLKNGQFYEEDWDKLVETMPIVQNAPIYVDDDPNQTILQIRAKARRMKAQFSDLGLVVVDYLQLMTGKSAENRQQEISVISRGLKILARELQCPVMALSQLSRGLEQRVDKRPMLSDLRESGSIEQDADCVMFIYRDEMYNPESSDRGTAEIIVAKQRNGPTGTAKVAYLGPYTKFANLAKGD